MIIEGSTPGQKVHPLAAEKDALKATVAETLQKIIAEILS
jgi:hypothetical protein